jgi:hypothetical protein
LALEAGRSARWVAGVLGHADPALTLRVYTHAIRAEEADLSFADFERVTGEEGLGEGPKRHYTAPALGESFDSATEDRDDEAGTDANPQASGQSRVVAQGRIELPTPAFSVARKGKK